MNGSNSEVAGEQIRKVPLEKRCPHSVVDTKQEESLQYLAQQWRVNRSLVCSLQVFL